MTTIKDNTPLKTTLGAAAAVAFFLIGVGWWANYIWNDVHQGLKDNESAIMQLRTDTKQSTDKLEQLIKWRTSQQWTIDNQKDWSYLLYAQNKEVLRTGGGAGILVPQVTQPPAAAPLIGNP